MSGEVCIHSPDGSAGIPVLYVTPCETKDGGEIDAIARIDGNLKQLIVQMCRRFKDAHPDDWTNTAADVIMGVFSFGEYKTLVTKVIDGNVYVVNLLSTGLPGGGKAYFAPGATTVMKLAPPEGTGYIDGGEYHLDIVVGGETECIEDLKIFGAEISKECLQNGCDKKLYILSKPYLEVRVSESNRCMNGLSMSIKATPKYAGLSPLYYDVGLYPLAVSFEDLVRALTCPNFELGNLQKDIAWSVLRAAVGNGSTDICSKEKDPFNGSDGYTWAVAPDQTQLTYVAKKNGTPTDNDYDFRIQFKGPDPVVWVKDVPKDNACDEVKDRIFTSELEKKYTNYDLHLIINGNDCLSKYGIAEKTELSRAMTYENVLKYGGLGAATCLAVTCACGALSLDAKSIATGVLTCSIGPLMGTTLTFASARAGIEESWKAPAASAGILAVTGVGVGAYKYWQTQELARIAKIDELTSLPKVPESEGVLFSVARGTIKRGAGNPTSPDSLAKVLFNRKAASGKTIKQVLADSGADNLDDAVKALKKAGASDDVIEYFEELKTLRDYAKKAKMGKVAEQLDDFVKKIKSASDAESLAGDIKNIDSALGFKNVNELWEAITNKLQNTLNKLKDKKFLCGTAGAIAGAITSSIAFMATTGDVDYLTVAINPGPVATISTEGGILWAHEGCISVNNATCPGHRW